MKKYICTCIKGNIATFQPIVECVNKEGVNLIFISSKEKQFLEITEKDNIALGCIKTINMSFA